MKEETEDRKKMERGNGKLHVNFNRFKTMLQPEQPRSVSSFVSFAEDIQRNEIAFGSPLS